MKVVLCLLITTAVALSACDPSTIEWWSTPDVTSTPSSTVTSPDGSAEPSREPVDSCPERPFDPAASLGPIFEQKYFERDEGRRITEAFLAGLAGIYARDPETDVCAYFTGSGLSSALATDERLRSVLAGDQRIDGTLILRVAFEGSYDLRARPPIVPVDAIFDLAAGTSITDLLTRAIQVSDTDQRSGLHLDLTFDGRSWYVQHVAPVSAENAQWARAPEPVPVGPPCTDFTRDPPGTPFDDDAATSVNLGSDTPGGERLWCNGGGDGLVIRQRDQLVLLTRFPCDVGHAAILTIGRPLGARLDPLVPWSYVRDPADEFLAQGWLRAPYDGNATLPADATPTGWTNGNIDLWISPSELDAAIYLKLGARVERWPRATDPWGVTDCN